MQLSKDVDFYYDTVLSTVKISHYASEASYDFFDYFYMKSRKLLLN